MSNNKDHSIFIDQLVKSYDLHLNRRESLERRAQQLLSFAAIIETLLVSFLLVLIANKDKVLSLLCLPLLRYVEIIYYATLICYIITVISSAIVLLIPKWISPTTDWEDIENFKHDSLNARHYSTRIAYGLMQGIELFKNQNAWKYTRLRIAFIGLIIGVILTATLCFILLMAILH